MSWDETTRRIKEANVLEDVASEYGVELKRSGKELFGLCPSPDHAESKPSFFISPKKQVFYCHGCGKGGSVFQFVMYTKQVSFGQARRILAKRAGIELSDEASEQVKSATERQEIWEAAVQVWQANLTRKILKWIKKKWGVTADTAHALRLGYATPGLFNALLKRGFSRNAIDKSGLFRKTASGRRAFYRKRLVFPILQHGGPVNLVGRLFPYHKEQERQRKFLKLANPDEGPPLPALYNTDLVRAGELLLVVEGYGDAAALYQTSYSVVALGGTRPSDLTLAVLARYAARASHVHLFFDFDATGQGAARDLAERLLPYAVHAQLVPPPPHEDGKPNDPADLVKRAGSDARKEIDRLLRAARLFVDVEIDEALTYTSPAQRTAALQNPLRHIAMLEPLVCDGYIRVLAEKFKLSPKHLRQAVKEARIRFLAEIEAKKPLKEQSYHVIAPSLGLVGDLWFNVVPIGERDKSRFVQVPYLVTSDKRLIRLSENTQLGGKAVLLRSHPFFTQSESRWRLDKLQKFRKAKKRIKASSVFQSLKKKVARYFEVQEAEILDFLAIWVIATYLYPLFDSCPYLLIQGPKNSGKTKLVAFLDFTCFNAIASANLSPAALFRTIERSGATLLLDEAERISSRNTPELAELLRAGYKRPSYAIRIQEQSFEPQLFDVFGPKAIANIRGLDDVLGSRCVSIPMMRALDVEKANRSINARSDDWPAVRGQLYRFAMDHFREVREAYETLQEHSGTYPIKARDFELWAPILAIAAFLEKKGCKGLTANTVKLAVRRTKEQETSSLSDWDTAILLAINEWKRQCPKASITTEVVKHKARKFLPDDEDEPNSKYIGGAIRRLGLGTGTKVNGRYRYRIALSTVEDRMKRYGVEYSNTSKKEPFT